MQVKRLHISEDMVLKSHSENGINLNLGERYIKYICHSLSCWLDLSQSSRLPLYSVGGGGGGIPKNSNKHFPELSSKFLSKLDHSVSHVEYISVIMSPRLKVPCWRICHYVFCHMGIACVREAHFDYCHTEQHN